MIRATRALLACGMAGVIVPAARGAALLAQAAPEIPAGVVTGAAAWTSAGLVGLVLFWVLYVQIPAKDKRDKEEREAKDALILKLISDFQALSTATGHRYENSLDKVCASHDAAISKVVEAHSATAHRLAASIDGLRQRDRGGQPT